MRNAVIATANRVQAADRAGQVPLVLGGDCTVGIGTVAGMSAAHPHARPGAGGDLRAQPRPRHPLGAGVITRRGLRTVPVEEVAHTSEGSAQAALARLLEVDHRLIHIDVDVINFTGAPLSENTGRNEGLTLDQAMAALRVFTAHPAFAARTITELNPLHGAAEGATLERFLAGLVHALRTDGARDCGPPSRRTNFNVLTETIRPYRESARKVADFADAAAPGRP